MLIKKDEEIKPTLCRTFDETDAAPLSELTYTAREMLRSQGFHNPDALDENDLIRLAGVLAENRMLKDVKQKADTNPVSATDAIAKLMDYSHPLYEAFDDAVKQATKGKGTRHGGDATPFMEQPWHQVSKHTGVGGLIFQMVKKAQEACGKEDQEAFERELLGALVYGGAAYLYVKQHGFKK